MSGSLSALNAYAGPGPELDLVAFGDTTTTAAPAPPATAAPPTTTAAPTTTVAPTTTTAPPPPPRMAAPPPPYIPPPFKAFRYEGFSVNRGSGKLLGSISESGNTYKVSEGDCVMGQYCITRLTEKDIEIEDLQLKRKQTFTRAQQ